MQKLLASSVAGASLLCLASAVFADGYSGGPSSYARPFSWTGLYVGVNGGYAFGSGSQQIVDTNNVGAVDIFRTADPSGWFGGGQIGYNWQTGLTNPLVLGIEADFQGASIEDSRTGIGTQAFLETHKVNIDWFGTVRGRIGYSFNRTLLYATGGLAYGDVDSRLSSPAAPGTFDRRHDTQVGFVVGGGLEQKLSRDWSAKVEYQYIDLGSERLLGTPGFALFHTNPLDTAFHTVRLGLNYQFQSERYLVPLK
jgi:outer membrane immunogenic protein